MKAKLLSPAGPAYAHPAAVTGPASTALWLFLMVVTALFSLFLVAYVLRMASDDWFPIALPPQIWLSTALLCLASLLLHPAAQAARRGNAARANALFAAAGVATLVFFAAQIWAWQVLLAQQVAPNANPMASFFYLLTAIHGLHVAGGMVGWWKAHAHAARDKRRAGGAMALCARYWHFLLAVWIVLLAAFSLLTPEIARAICGID